MVARQFSDPTWIFAPVVDDNILLGRITIDDVVDIIREQSTRPSARRPDEDEWTCSPVRRVPQPPGSGWA